MVGLAHLHRYLIAQTHPNSDPIIVHACPHDTPIPDSLLALPPTMRLVVLASSPESAIRTYLFVQARSSRSSR